MILPWADLSSKLGRLAIPYLATPLSLSSKWQPIVEKQQSASPSLELLRKQKNRCIKWRIRTAGHPKRRTTKTTGRPHGITVHMAFPLLLSKRFLMMTLFYDISSLTYLFSTDGALKTFSIDFSSYFITLWGNSFEFLPYVWCQSKSRLKKPSWR